MRRPLRFAALVAAALLVATGCTVDTSVRVDVHDDGSGVVTVVTALDAEAVRAVETGGGHLEDRIRVADLERAGWSVTPWARAKDGTARLAVSKRFGTPEQLAGVLGEVNGTAGPLRDFQLTRDDGLLTVDYRLRGRVDLAAMGTGLGDDAALVQSLTGQRVDPNTIDAQLLAQLRNALRMQVVVATPGGTTTVTGRPGSSVPIDVSTSVAQVRRLVLGGVAAVVLVCAAVLWFWPDRARRRAAFRSELSSAGNPAADPGPRPNPPARRGIR